MAFSCVSGVQQDHRCETFRANRAVLCCAAVPGAPPRKVEADAINSTALRVAWKPPLTLKQHGLIRGYQLVYSRLEKGEPHGQPMIVDISSPEAQVRPHPLQKQVHAQVISLITVTSSLHWFHAAGEIMAAAPTCCWETAAKGVRP